MKSREESGVCLSSLSNRKAAFGRPSFFLLLAILVSSFFSLPAFSQTPQALSLEDDFETEELKTLAAAEKFLLGGQPNQAADLLAPLSLEGHHGPAILQIRTWALYHSQTYGELALLLEALPHLSGEYRYLRGAARLRTGDWEGGKGDLQSIWWDEPQTLWGMAALRELAVSNLPGTYSQKERAIIRHYIPDVGYQSRQSVSTLNRSIRRALRRRAPPKGVLSSELLFAEGVRLLKKEEFAAAAQILNRALRANQNSDLTRVIELNLAEALRFKGAYKIAMGHFDHVAETGTDELRYKALSQAARMAIHYRKYPDAKARYQALLLSNPLGPAREQALWGLGWVAFRNKKFSQSRQFFQTLLSEQPYGPRAAGAIYWGARCLEEQKKIPDALANLRALLERFPVDYYAYRASEVLARLQNKSDSPRQATLPPKTTDPKVSHIEGLARTGLKERSRRALVDVLPYAVDYLSPIELDVLFDAAKSVGLKRLAGRMKGIRNRRFPEANPSAIHTLAANFPAPYVQILRTAARPHRLDPNLVISLARQESAFNPQAISSAGALGLLQLMPKTAVALIRERKPKANPTVREIMHPRLNAKLGTRYLGRMMRTFEGHLEYALAAYNAGPGAVTRWRQRRGYLPAEIFVEEIPYRETRLYIRKILSWKRKFEFMLAHRDQLKKARKRKQSRRVKPVITPG